MMLLRLALVASALNVVAATLRDAILDRPDLTRFRSALDALGLLNELLDDETQSFTVFAPSDSAIDDSFLFNYYFSGMYDKPNPKWHYHLQAAVHNAIVPGPGLKKGQIFNNQISELLSLQDPLLISQFLGRVGGAPIETADIDASNGVLHVVSMVMQPEFFDHTFADLELQSEFGPDQQGRVSLVDVVDFSGSRNEFTRIREDGTTQVGCRTRAFNKMGLDYLTQTINGSPNVKFGELMNATRRNETYDEMTYSLIPKNYYVEDLPPGFFELVMPVNECAHMWVSKHDGVLVFNNGRTIATPDERKFIASNGPGYVVDKCLLCPGISMLAKYASEWTPFDTAATAQFFTASGWNMRDLRQSVGAGGDLTLFAPTRGAWDVLNLEDVTRLGTPKWEPHQWDLLGNMLVEGIWLEQDLKDKYIEMGGPYTLNSTLSQLIPIDYDEAKDIVKVNGGDLFLSDIKGVDGYAHFVTKATLPFSMTDNVYRVGKKRDDLSFHLTLIDTVFLNPDLERLLPLTVLYVPNDAWTGTKIELEDIAPVVLESHIFKELLFCEDLLRLEGTRKDSLNGESWFITKNDDNMPCFLTDPATFGGPAKMACFTECDILARNGLVHVLDSLLVYTENDDVREIPITDIPIQPTAPQNAPTVERPDESPTSALDRPAFAASNSVFDKYTPGSGSASNNADNGGSSAVSQRGGLVLAGMLCLMLVLQL